MSSLTCLPSVVLPIVIFFILALLVFANYCLLFPNSILVRNKSKQAGDCYYDYEKCDAVGCHIFNGGQLEIVELSVIYLAVAVAILMNRPILLAAVV